MTVVVADQPSMSPRRTRFVRHWAGRLVAFGEFIDGYDLLVIGAAMLFLRPYFDLTPFQVGVVTAAAFVGTAVGLLVFGDLSDRFGRRVILMINLVFFVAASIAAAFVQDVWQLVAARFVLGVAVGMDIPTTHAFLAEIAPTSRRGRIAGSLPNMMWLGGAIVSVLLALALKPVFGEETWRWLFGLAALPAAAVLLARQFLPESPRWLRAQGRVEEAQRVYDTLGLEPPKHEAAVRRNYRALWSGGAWRRLVTVTAFFAIQAFGGAVATVAGPLIISSLGIGVSNTLYFSLLGYVMGIIAVAAGALVIDRINRRWLGVWTCLGVFGAGLGIAFTGENPGAGLVIFWAVYATLTWLGPGVLCWVWSAEAFPTALRGLGSGIAQAATRLAIALNVFLVPTLVQEHGIQVVAWYAFAFVVCAVLVAASPWLATTGVELEEVNEAESSPSVRP
ncbi:MULTISPECIES: MFS transporter [unclassified Crossiella]|uniref:MFS transporter n=1 Tax=unclassified Crossiella TaxID=2620835 RepID=UPI001FFF437C|nr:MULTISPECIES: MFS transporter [unclassified Crossiella]MCK2244355.1 sugar porter family MFS transporter [Crossiella sp. S99.2]MCK2257817.1 sugar porter family MFS transporter [Crossiella sp. S99.1]